MADLIERKAIIEALRAIDFGEARVLNAIRAVTYHAINWLRPSQMVCGVAVIGRQQADRPIQITCDMCSLRVLRTGQRLGMDITRLASWTWSELYQWRGEEQL